MNHSWVKQSIHVSYEQQQKRWICFTPVAERLLFFVRAGSWNGCTFKSKSEKDLLWERWTFKPSELFTKHIQLAGELLGCEQEQHFDSQMCAQIQLILPANCERGPGKNISRKRKTQSLGSGNDRNTGGRKANWDSLVGVVCKGGEERDERKTRHCDTVLFGKFTAKLSPLAALIGLSTGLFVALTTLSALKCTHRDEEMLGWSTCVNRLDACVDWILDVHEFLICIFFFSFCANWPEINKISFLWYEQNQHCSNLSYIPMFTNWQWRLKKIVARGLEQLLLRLYAMLYSIQNLLRHFSLRAASKQL